MKAFFFKANRGILLFAVVLACICIYLISDTVKNKKQCKEVVAIAEQFVIDSGDTYECPEDFDFSLIFDPHFIQEFSSKQMEPVIGYFSDNPTVRKSAMAINDDFWMACLGNEDIPVSCSRQPYSTKVNVYRNTATVTVHTNNVIESKDGSGFYSSESFESTEQFFFMYENGKWVIYSYTSSLSDNMQYGGYYY